jgi:hypothetical protein
MKKCFFIFCSILTLSTSISAQKGECITVKAGTRVIDYYPFEERYRYPEFTPGQIFFKNGSVNSTRINYNLLMDEMEFIQGRDTLAFIKKKEIKQIVVAQDTFFFDNGYLEQIKGGSLKVGLRKRIILKEILSQDSYGTASTGSSTNSYGALPSEGNFYKLAANKNMVFQKTMEYYFATPTSGFVQFRKKSVLQLYPEKSVAIKAYLKSNNVDFDSREDILKLVEFLKTL